MNLLELAESIGVRGFLHCAELDRLVQLAARKDVLEVGAYCGLSAWGMAISAHSIYSIDTFAAATDGQRQTGKLTTLDDYLRAVSRYRNVRHFVGTSEQADLQAHPVGQNTELGSFVPNGQFDFIFIDATHTYEECKADIQRWWPRVKDGGVMAVHDYRHAAFPGVEKAVDELFGTPKESDVTVTLREIHK